MERKRYLVGDDVQAKRAALGKLIVSLEISKGQAKVKYTFPLACAGLYGVPPGRLERPHMAPEATALSTELRGLTKWILAQTGPFGKNG